MYKRIAAVLFVCCGLGVETAFAQAPPNPTQQSVAQSEGQVVPLFRVTVVGRSTPAINYRPRRGDTKIDFAGTALLPQARGNATVSGEQGYIKIDARFDKMEAPARFGAEYLTYVLWAITPEGRASNLGEVQFDDDDARVQVTTDLQAFGLIVTAEPYFAVSQPSDVVVIENVVRDGTTGSIEAIQAKYELLKRGTYLMNQAAANYKVKALEPGAPLDLAEARNAVALAQLAGADKYAADTYTKAARLLADAEMAREKKQGSNAIMMPARQAAQTAEDARLIALQKQEEAFIAEQRALSLQRERDALDRAGAETARRQQAELEAATAKAATERERAAAERDRAEAQAARSAAEAARLAAEGQVQAAVAQGEKEKAELRARLLQQLNVILETRETARGLIVNLSDVLFDSGSANLKAGAREKLARVSGVLLSHPGLSVSVEGHTDSVGAESFNQRLSEQRASSVQAYLTRQGIAPAAVGTTGFGESQPVVSNDTAAGRQQNRRVELVVTGDAIGRR
jgi:outer membrane protein OmpA-like peptidoglycan-associated protein